MDDLAERLKELERNPQPDLWDAIEMRSRTNHRHPGHRLVAAVVAIVVGIAAVAIAIAAFGGSNTQAPVATPSPAAGAYQVTFVGFDHEDQPSTVVAKMQMQWAGSTFPGVTECTFTAVDADGNKVGSQSAQLYVLHPDEVMRFVQEIGVDATPISVTGSCDKRLDVGDPYNYDLGRPSVIIQGDSALVMVKPKWLGGGTPGIMDCQATLVHQDGSVVGRQTFIEPEHLGIATWEMRFTSDELDADLRQDPMGMFPDVVCVPYVDGNETFPARRYSPLPSAVHIDYQSSPGMGYVFSDVVFRPTLTGWITSYTTHWENGVFPGEHHCEISVTDGSGRVLATDSTDFESLQDGVGGEIDSDTQPSGFDATCGPRLDMPIPYVIVDPRVVTSNGGTAIEFTVEFPVDLPADAYIGTNQCVAAIVASGHVVSAQPFTLSAPAGTTTQEGTSDKQIDPGEMQGAKPVVSCEPFQSEKAMSSMVQDFTKRIEGG